MDAERLRQIEHLYHAALELDPVRRDALLRESCIGDEELRAQVERLLAMEGELDGPLDRAVWEHAPPTPLSTGREIGPYRIESVLGEGGMGVVYRALDTKLNRPVALKFLSALVADPAARRRFQREAQTASALNHPHIVTVYDAGELDRRQYLVTEFVDGGTLRQWMSRKRTWREIVGLMTGVADALASAHEAKILHRDIKPENILLTTSGYAKLADFGLAKLLEAPRAPAESTVTAGTQPGAILGTCAYMSPEQASGLELDARSDVFSFGVVLYEMLSGVRPFNGITQVDILHAVINTKPAPLPDGVPHALRNLVEKSMEKDSADRYQTMRDMVVDLRRLTRQPVVPEKSTVAVLEHTPPGVGNRAWRWVAAGCLAGALAMGLFAFSRPHRVDPKYTPFSVSEDYPQNPIWSPNGEAVAYTAMVDGKAQVFLRYLKSPTVTQLTHGNAPSRAVGWTADSKKIYIPGKNPQGDQPPAALFVVPVFGGEPELVTPMPAFYAITVSGDGRSAALLVKQRDAPASVLVSSPVGGPWKEYSPLPFVTQRVVGMPGLKFSRTGKNLYCWIDADSWDHWILPWPPASGKPRRILTSYSDRGSIHYPSWSPDERHLILSFGKHASQHDKHLFLVDTADSTVFPVTGGTGREETSAVSPDGNKIVYAEAPIDFNIVTASLADASLAQTIATSRNENMPSWSAASRRLVYGTDRNGEQEIWMREANGSERPLATHASFPRGTTHFFLGPTLSPDGTRCIYARRDNSASPGITSRPGEPKLWISAVSGGPAVRLTNTNNVEHTGCWSPDGRRFAYMETAGNRLSLMTVKTTGQSAPSPIVSTSGQIQQVPDWSPAGDWITWRTADGWSVISPDGKATIALGEITTPHLAFSNDGKLLYGIRWEDQHRYLFSLDLASRQMKTIGDVGKENGPASDFVFTVRPSLTPDGKGLTYAVMHSRSDLWLLEDYPQPPSFRLPWFR